MTIPDHAVADGMHCFLILDGASGTKLGDFALMAGEAISDDLRARWNSCAPSSTCSNAPFADIAWRRCRRRRPEIPRHGLAA